MPKVVSSRLAWSFTRQTSQVLETPGQELLALVPQSPAWFVWLEGGRRRALAAISWAIDDALKTFGVWVKTLPVTPQRVLAWIEAAKGERSSLRGEQETIWPGGAYIDERRQQVLCMCSPGCSSKWGQDTFSRICRSLSSRSTSRLLDAVGPCASTDAPPDQ